MAFVLRIMYIMSNHDSIQRIGRNTAGTTDTGYQGSRFFGFGKGREPDEGPIALKRIRINGIKGIVTAVVAVFSAATAHAAALPGSSGQYYRVVAPPRETLAVGEQDFGSVTTFLTKVTRHKFVYEQPNSWLQYQSWVWQN